MRIVLDLSPVRTTGTVVHSNGFLPALADLLRPDDEVLVFAPPQLEGLLARLAPKGIRAICREMFLRVPVRMAWQQAILPGLLEKAGADVLFSPFDMAPLRTRCPMVLGVKNPNPIVMADASLIGSRSGNARFRIHHFLVRESCSRARSVIFPSKYAAERAGGLLHVPREKREVANHGLDLEFWLQADAGHVMLPANLVPGKYVLFASKFYLQKRAGLLLEAFAKWKKRFGRADFRLVYTGEPADSAAATSVIERSKELGLAESVHVLGVVERPMLHALYRHAGVFALPTVLETFGFPYIEAMACGLPLVCAEIEVARELCGTVPFYFEADNVEGFAETLEAAVDDSPARASRLAMGADLAKGFSWAREARETLEIIRAAACN